MYVLETKFVCIAMWTIKLKPMEILLFWAHKNALSLLFYLFYLFKLTSLTADSRVAVKVIRNVEKYRDAAQIEIDILEKIRKAGGCEVSSILTSSLMTSQLLYDVTCQPLVQDLLTKQTGSCSGEDERCFKFAASLDTGHVEISGMLPPKLVVNICYNSECCKLLFKGVGEYLTTLQSALTLDWLPINFLA